MPQFPYLTLLFREFLNHETQDTLIPGSPLSGKKSYLRILIDIVLSLSALLTQQNHCLSGLAGAGGEKF